MIFEFNWLNQDGFLNAIHLISKVLNIIRIAVPIGLIVMTTIDITKKVINPEDKEGQKKIMYRAIAALIVFLVPTLINLIFRIAGIEQPDNDIINNPPTISPKTPAPSNTCNIDNCMVYASPKTNDNCYCSQCANGYVPTIGYKSCRLASTLAPRVTATPTVKPTIVPTVAPTVKPTVKPTVVPTVKPTAKPTARPTTKPTVKPTTKPTVVPTVKPTTEPTVAPTTEPTVVPTTVPTFTPIPTPKLVCSPEFAPYLKDESAMFCNDIYQNYSMLLSGAEVKLQSPSYVRYYGCIKSITTGKYNVYECYMGE